MCAATVSQTLLMSFVSDINLAEIGNMASSSLQKKGGPLAREFGRPPRGSMKEDPLVFSVTRVYRWKLIHIESYPQNISGMSSLLFSSSFYEVFGSLVLESSGSKLSSLTWKLQFSPPG